MLQKEDSFVRTGSGRKLPKIPQRSLSANSGRLQDNIVSRVVKICSLVILLHMYNIIVLLYGYSKQQETRLYL